jgi:mercuric ion transport protein
MVTALLTTPYQLDDEQSLLAVAGLLITAVAGMWWLHRRRTARTARAAAHAGSCGCGGRGCGC